MGKRLGKWLERKVIKKLVVDVGIAENSKQFTDRVASESLHE